MRTSELTGHALDWAVAEADGTPIERKQYSDPDDWVWCYQGLHWSPSIDWRIGGPIIERELIEIRFDGAEGFLWWGYHPKIDDLEHGPTPLVAAMRCYVASKLGEEVDVPEELT